MDGWMSTILKKGTGKEIEIDRKKVKNQKTDGGRMVEEINGERQLEEKWNNRPKGK